jgi:integrase
MATSRRRKPRRKRVGRVSYYYHHGGWWIYYRDGQRIVRRRIGGDEAEAGRVAAQVNAQLATAAPTMFSFTPVTVPELCRRFVDHHEYVAKSSLATVRRYQAAVRHLENFAARLGGNVPAHEIPPDQFARFLRSTKVAPNGHPNTARRHLRDKGVQFVLEVCRSLYGFAARNRHLPPYSANPFASLGGKHAQIEDAKQVFVFDDKSELAFFQAADAWSFPIHFTMAKSGIRPGEAVHLLIEDADLDGGWLYIRNKAELGWRIKTRRERAIPLVDELVAVLRHAIDGRTTGPVFLREKYDPSKAPLGCASREAMARALAQRIEATEQQEGQSLGREARAKIARTVWRDAGAIKADRIRISFIRTAEALGLSNATCPKSWRHTFATLLQDANVDPLVRQITLGHAPNAFGTSGGLGMTAVYTHTRSETQRREILRAIRLWRQSLEFAQSFIVKHSRGFHNNGRRETG